MSQLPWALVATKLLMTGSKSEVVLPQQLDSAKCLEVALAGTTVTYLQRNPYNKLSPSQLAQLHAAGAKVTPGHYDGGLVTVQLTTTNRTPNLLELLRHFQERTLAVLTNPLDPCSQSMHDLFSRYKVLREQLNAAIRGRQEKKPTLSEILEELKSTLTRIGCLILPENFLPSIKHPQQFLSNVAPNLGLYVVSLIAASENEVPAYRESPPSPP
jgi:hypothetical protein